MAIFSYKGINSSGKEIKATINSEGLTQAKQKLKSQGIMLIEIVEQKADTMKQKNSINFGGGVNIENLSLMTRQLATLIKAKIQIVEALSALMDQTEHPKLKVVLSEIKQKVNEGSSLTASLNDYPKIFNNVYVNMVEAGEQSGNLEVVLMRLADFTESQLKLKNKIKGALTYPIIMVLIGTVMFGVIFAVVIPKIAKIFVSMKRELPLMTRISIGISNIVQNYWWLLIISAVATFYLIRKFIASPRGEFWWHKTILKLPLVGELVTMINVSRFSSTLATLLNSGVPILTSLNIVKNLIANVHMQKAVEEARSYVQEGASMSIPLIKSQLFPTMMTHMIKLGERSGEIEPMLMIVSENYEDQVNNKLNNLTSTLEPIMMVAMGLGVGFVVFSVVIPMMELNSIQR